MIVMTKVLILTYCEGKHVLVKYKCICLRTPTMICLLANMHQNIFLICLVGIDYLKAIFIGGYFENEDEQCEPKLLTLGFDTKSKSISETEIW